MMELVRASPIVHRPGQDKEPIRDAGHVPNAEPSQVDSKQLRRLGRVLEPELQHQGVAVIERATEACIQPGVADCDPFDIDAPLLRLLVTGGV
jgi:hypothetical protein